MLNNKIYWFITVFEGFKLDEYDNIRPRNIRTWGFYANKEDALNTLKYNITDHWETVYNYAILEPYYEGISGYCFEEERLWFKYDKFHNSYKKIEEPKEVKHYASFAIG